MTLRMTDCSRLLGLGAADGQVRAALQVPCLNQTRLNLVVLLVVDVGPYPVREEVGADGVGVVDLLDSQAAQNWPVVGVQDRDGVVVGPFVRQVIVLAEEVQTDAEKKRKKSFIGSVILAILQKKVMSRRQNCSFFSHFRMSVKGDTNGHGPGMLSLQSGRGWRRRRARAWTARPTSYGLEIGSIQLMDLLPRQTD